MEIANEAGGPGHDPHLDCRAPFCWGLVTWEVAAALLGVQASSVCLRGPANPDESTVILRR